MRRAHLHMLIGLVAGVFINGAADAVDVRGYVAGESRTFPQEATLPDQTAADVSLSSEIEFYHAIGGKNDLKFVPFGRVDSGDSRRTHFDVRELYWAHYENTWELLVGFNRVFWGVTESQHLVDIINQTDLVENPDGEDKLGQPMVRLSLIRDWGTTQLFLMSGFRERTYPGESGRPRFPLLVDTGNAVYEARNGRAHVDWALRWSHYVGPLDIGLSYFSGTGRDPLLVPKPGSSGAPVLVPYYPLIDQSAIDAQMTLGGWLWKLEALSRWGQGDRFTATTFGFEYTFVGVGGSALDLGVLAEHLWDERGSGAQTPFDNDVFLGARLAFNDVQSASLLAGVIVDLEGDANVFRVEGSRRMFSSWSLDVEARAVGASEVSDPLHAFRNDGFLQFDLTRHF